MPPAFAMIALLVVLLVVLPATALAMWLVRSRLVGRDRRFGLVAAEAVEPLAQLDLAGLANRAEMESLSPRERQFMAQAIGTRLSGSGGATAREARPEPTTDREVPLSTFILVCPACGASLGTAADIAHYVGACPSCSRRVASRRRGSRVSLAMEEGGRRQE